MSKGDEALDMPAFLSITYTCILFHTIWILMFIILDIPTMAIINIGSVIIYLIAYLLLRRGAIVAWGIFMVLELVIHAVAASICIGWDSGFHYYLLTVPYTIFISSNKNRKASLFIFIVIIIIYILLNVCTEPDQHIISAWMMKVFNIMNSCSIFLILAWLANIYRNKIDDYIKELHVTNEELANRSSIDSLTGLYNRGIMIEKVSMAWGEKELSGQPFCIILGDIDNFKSFNDQYGHECGDSVLIQCAAKIKHSVGMKGSIARWGGEEFLILLPNADLQTASAIGESIRQAICEQSFEYKGRPFTTSMTFGVAAIQTDKTIEELINRADQALYRGKRRGKNCVVTAARSHTSF
ncbi:GGDEF domain-containing protein [Paenibacillus sp. FA6]|uniref:GGDEF domain-containing protein n=1 Tax=Paenibacillus sp. FA6 TaxID=3413029 RepID=UPI003F658A6D